MIKSNTKTWQFNEAKAKLTEFMKKAKKEPQIITKHGKPEIIAMDIEMYEKLTNKKGNIVSFFKNSPLYGIDIDINRDNSAFRDINL